MLKLYHRYHVSHPLLWTLTCHRLFSPLLSVQVLNSDESSLGWLGNIAKIWKPWVASHELMKCNGIQQEETSNLPGLMTKWKHLNADSKKMKALSCWWSQVEIDVKYISFQFVILNWNQNFWDFNFSKWIEIKPVWISICHNELKWKLCGFQFIILNWKKQSLDFNLSFWIELKSV